MGLPPKTAPPQKPTDYCKFPPGQQYWSMAPDAEATLLSAETGWASTSKVPHETIPELFLKASKKASNNPALRTENMLNVPENGEIPAPLPLNQWKTTSWRKYYQNCRDVAKAMIAHGFQPHDSANVLGFNSPEWLTAMFGAMFAGGKVAGIYGTDNEHQIQFKSHHSNGSIAFVEDSVHLGRFKGIIDDVPYLKVIVTWGCKPGEDFTRSDGTTCKTISFDDFLEAGRKLNSDALEERLSGIRPGHCCALIYTSGTTGKPKAVMVSHDALIYEGVSAVKGTIKVLGKGGEERVLSYLPLSHIAGILADTVFPMTVTAYMPGYASSNFARPYDLKKGSLVARLQTVKPTLFFGVPRVWEKIMEKMVAAGASVPDGWKKRLIGRAKVASLKHQQGQQLGGDGVKPGWLWLYKKLLNKVKVRLGLDKCKMFFAGAAPMTEECLNYFGSLGINVNELYGMSECVGSATLQVDLTHEWGTIGYALPGVEVRIFKIDPETGNKTECPPAKDIHSATEEEQGEICFRGRNNMIGYMANEKFGEEHMEQIEKKNIDAIDEEGYIHSGDKGAMDARGMVKITGRYKELIIGAGGENIAPVPIEDELKRLCPFAGNIMMIGNKRKFNVILVTLKTVGATGELPGTDELDGPARLLSNSSATIEEAMKDDVFINAIKDAINEVNNNKHVCPSNAAKVQKFTILPRDFSVETGEFTATLKLKRSVVDDMWKSTIDNLYSSSETYVPYSE
mmetsp:Transcript_8340/g.10875  ORF Transcript_8340/g.10875 Transcript_8340/m.10875 type:complete len:738 (+) Transcript_8340:56-2269(+)